MARAGNEAKPYQGQDIQDFPDFLMDILDIQVVWDISTFQVILNIQSHPKLEMFTVLPCTQFSYSYRTTLSA